MNKNDMIDLLNHLITTGRFWHLEYARQNVIEDEFQKIKKERDKFDNDILKKGLDIINSTEPEGDIRCITIFMKHYKIELSCDEYSSHQLRQILNSLEDNKDVIEQNNIKKLIINNEDVIGYDVTYDSEYKQKFHKAD